MRSALLGRVTIGQRPKRSSHSPRAAARGDYSLRYLECQNDDLIDQLAAKTAALNQTTRELDALSSQCEQHAHAIEAQNARLGDL